VVTDEIKALRSRWPDWGAGKLLHKLRERNSEFGSLSRCTVHRILLREGLVRERNSHPPATGSFQREEPNQLWQMDFKGPKGFLKRSGPLSVMDDHSRYLLALQHLENGRIASVQGCLQRIFRDCGLSDAMLMEHGTPWWNANENWGWTELTVWLMRQGIRIYLSGYRHPQTQGKVERMHGVLTAAIRERVSMPISKAGWTSSVRSTTMSDRMSRSVCARPSLYGGRVRDPIRNSPSPGNILPVIKRCHSTRKEN
jgi:transposase InsO family protein